MTINKFESSSTLLDQGQIDKAHGYLCNQVASLPHILITKEQADLAALTDVADRYRRDFDDVVILGTGGSSLGAKTLCALQETPSPRMHFMDNVDPHTFKVLFASLEPKKTGFLVVSKSGNTAETMAQFFICKQAWQTKVGIENLAHHFLVITEPRTSALQEQAQKYDLPCLDHPTDIGGRFSCLTLVGLLPAMIAGLDAFKVRSGAQRYFDSCLQNKNAAPITGAVSALDKPIQVLMPYVDRLADFGMWYRQLWAESLGKDGKGLTPIRAMGTVDQHSQLQLYLDGPKDKTFTVLALESEGHGDVMRDTGVDYLEGHTLGDLLAAEAKATLHTLKDNDCPVRMISLSQLDEETMGELFMHYILETLLTAHLLDVDAFSQPAVEQGKILTREYLAA